MRKTPRQVRQATRRMEHYGAKRASAPDPKGLAAAAFDQLRATLPPDDEAWRRIDTALTEFIHEKERQTS